MYLVCIKTTVAIHFTISVMYRMRGSPKISHYKVLLLGAALGFGLMFLGTGNSLAFSGSGDGSSGSPFQITNCAQLQSIASDVTASYALENNINCSGSGSFNGGDGWAPIVSFSGTLDGQDYSVTNLTIDYSGFATNAGLFSSIVSGGVVENLTITANVTAPLTTAGILTGSLYNAQIINVVTHGTLSCDSFCGSFAGFVSGLVTVADSHSDVDVSGDTKVGGLFGKVDSVGPGNTTTVTNSYFSGDVTGTGSLIGGISAPSTGLILEDVYTSGSVSGTSSVGGLIASFTNIGSVIRSFSTSTVHGVNSVGGLVGSAGGGDVSMENVFYNGDVVATGSNIGGLAGTGSFDHVSFGYAAGSVTGGESVGGIFGDMIGGSIDHLFAANHIVINGGIFKDALVASFSGFNPQDIHDHTSHVYFDPNTTIDLYSSSFGTAFANSNGFLGSSDGPMFNGWDFIDIWLVNPDEFPTIRPTSQPGFACHVPDETTTGFSDNCFSLIAGWGTTHWSVQWSKVGSSVWHNVTVADGDTMHFSVSGLSSSTDYLYRVRITDLWGTTDWLTIPFTTVAVSSSKSPATTASIDEDESVPADTTSSDVAEPVKTASLEDSPVNPFVEPGADLETPNNSSHIGPGLIIAMLALLGLIGGTLYFNKPE